MVLAVPASAAVSSSKNPHLKAAYKLFDAFEYDAALLKLDKAEQWPSNTAQDKVEIALLEGVLSYETQQQARGDRAFQRALEMDPGAKLLLKVSPKVAARLEELRKPLPPPPLLPPPPTPAPTPEIVQRTASPPRMNLKLPVAIGGGVVAVGGVLAWVKAKSLDSKVRNADPSLTTRTQIDDTLKQVKTFQTVGWILVGVGVATTAGSLLFLDAPAEGKATVTPVAQGAQLSMFWSLP